MVIPESDRLLLRWVLLLFAAGVAFVAGLYAFGLIESRVPMVVLLGAIGVVRVLVWFGYPPSER